MDHYLRDIIYVIWVQIQYLVHMTLLGPDYFDEEAKCYSRLFEFCQVTFCHSRQWGRMALAKF